MSRRHLKPLHQGISLGASMNSCRGALTNRFDTAYCAVITEKRDVIFPNYIASSLRRNPDGSVRRVNKWTGRNLQTSQIETRSENTNKASDVAGGSNEIEF